PGHSEPARGRPPPPGNSSPSSHGQYLASRSSSLAPRLILEPCPAGSPAWLPSRLLVGKGNANAVPSPKHRGELLDDPGEVVEGVSELVPRRHRVVTEAGVVGSEHAVAVGQGRDQVAEHLRAGREAVQEQYRRRVFRPGLAVEDVQVAGLD